LHSMSAALEAKAHSRPQHWSSLFNFLTHRP
jgi:hypothetical protein